MWHRKNDVSLERARTDAQNQVPGGERRGRFFMQDGLLYKESPTEKKHPHGGICKQLVVPNGYRGDLLKLAHDGPFAGHLDIDRTCDRLMQNFYWPQLFKTGRDYYRICDLCQKHKRLKRPSKAPLQPLPHYWGGICQCLWILWDYSLNLSGMERGIFLCW